MIKVILATTAAEKHRADFLERKILRHKRLYYAGKPKITDAKFDALEDELRELRPNSIVLKKVGSPIASKKMKVKLPYFLGSLDKIKPGTGSVDAWVKSHPGPYVISDKVDGSTLFLDYDGSQLKVYTRGNGVMGGEISFLAPHLRVPKLKKKFSIRGEAVMPLTKFEKYKKEFDNARNMVGGILNRKLGSEGVHQAVKDVKFIAYQVYYPNLPPSKAFIKAKALGFNIVRAIKVSKLTDEFLVDYLQERKHKAPYHIDGLVITQDKVNRLATGSNPDWAVAFKMTASDNIANTEVIKVEWNPSKHGALKPRIQVKKVRLSEATIGWATAFNAKYIKDNKIGPGAIVKLTRSGDVIPYILQVVKPAATWQQPKGNWEWSESGVDIYLKDAGKSDIVQVKRIASFFSTIGVEYFSRGLVKNFYEDGLDSILKIIRAPKSRFLQVPGIKERSATKIRTNIDQALKSVTLPSLMDASGAFGIGVGTRRVQMVEKVYPNLISLANLDDKSLYAKLLKVPGFSSKTSKLFIVGLRKFMPWYAKLGIHVKKAKPPKKVSGKLQGHHICFTGFRSSELETQIEANGGEIASGVSSKVTILLVKNPNSGSSKLQKARDLGIKIMTEDMFRQKFGI